MQLMETVESLSDSSCVAGGFARRRVKNATQNYARLFRSPLRDAHLLESAEQVRLAPFKRSKLIWSAFRDDQEFATRNPRTQKATDALLTARSFPYFEQVNKIPQVHNGISLRSFTAHLLTALLPHAKTNRPRHQACAVCGPERCVAEAEFTPASRQLAHQRALAAAGWPDQQHTAPVRPAQGLGEL